MGLDFASADPLEVVLISVSQQKDKRAPMFFVLARLSRQISALDRPRPGSDGASLRRQMMPFILESPPSLIRRMAAHRSQFGPVRTRAAPPNRPGNGRRSCVNWPVGDEVSVCDFAPFFDPVLSSEGRSVMTSGPVTTLPRVSGRSLRPLFCYSSLFLQRYFVLI